MFTRDHTEMLTRTPADIDWKMRIKTMQWFGVNLGLDGLNQSQNSLREITGKVRTMPGGNVACASIEIQIICNLF